MTCFLAMIDTGSARRRIFGAAAVVLLAVAPAAAAGGRWVYEGQSTTPTQEALSAVKPGPGRVHEARISGGFQATETSIGTIDLFFESDDAERRVFLATCTASFRIDGDPWSGKAEKNAFSTRGIVQSEGNDLAKANGGSCIGRISVDNADYAAATEPAPLGATTNAEGTIVLPRGFPGATTTVHVSAYLSSGNGALGGTLHARFHWVAD